MSTTALPITERFGAGGRRLKILQQGRACKQKWHRQRHRSQLTVHQMPLMTRHLRCPSYPPPPRPPQFPHHVPLSCPSTLPTIPPP